VRLCDFGAAKSKYHFFEGEKQILFNKLKKYERLVRKVALIAVQELKGAHSFQRR
jgi:hypothetical protein